MKIHYRKLLLGTALAGLEIIVQSPVQGQIFSAAQWNSACTTEVLQAPVPPNLQVRLETFNSRNSAAGLKQVADQFFALISMRGDMISTNIINAYRSGNYRQALDLYRDFFIQRLRLPPPNYPIQPKPPQMRTFLEWLPTGDELMSNIFVFAMIDNATNKVTVRIKIGEPGQVNWTWQPPGFKNPITTYLPQDASFMSAALGTRNCFDVLLTSYLKTKDKAYLEKWAAFNDDRCMNWQRDTWDADLKLWTDWHFNLGNYFNGIFPAFAYLAQNVPDFERDLPSPTLARMLTELWSLFMPIDIRGERQAGPNRRIGMYGSQIFNLGISFPEFMPAQYCLREWRRTLESYAALYLYPDGSDFESSRNYNLVYFNEALEKWEYLRKRINPLPPLYEMAPPWVTRLWVNELMDNLKLRVNFVIHYVANSGYLPEWGGYINRGEAGRTMVAGWWDRFFLPSFPDVLAKPDNARILSCIYDDGSFGEPSFTSEAFPFIGSYLLRTGWGRKDLFLMLKCSAQGMDAINNNIFLEAYGQDFFRPEWDSPLVVDGLPQGFFREDSIIAEIRRTGIVPSYSLSRLLTTNRQPLPNRWSTSTNLDLCEGFCELPFRREIWRQSGTSEVQTVTGVSHQRQVMLLRDPRLIIVTDRIRSPTTHTYRIQWKPATPVEVRNQSVPGFATKQIFVDPGQPSFKTRNPAIPNLSIYPFSALPLSVERATGVGALNEPYCAYTFQGQGEMTVVTVLYPRPTMEADVKQISSLKGAENTAGFKTELNDGTLVTYQAAAQAAPLNVGEVAGTASGLLWVRGSNGTEYGLALDCRALKLRDKNQPKLPASDFEFVISTSKRSFFSLSALGELASRGKSSALSYTPIYRPLALVEFLPKADVFTDKVEVAMSSATPDAEIRYTLDGTDPTDNSPLYNGPVTLASTCQVKARSFRKGVTKVPPTASGTEASAVTWAIYTRKAPFEPPKQEATLPGINFAYYEGDFSLSSPTIDIFKPVKTGVVKELFDFSARQTKNNYAFVYGGFIDIPQDGVYSFHAPMELIYPIMDAGYDLCVFLGREEWYPATRWHNYGAWSVPLKKGSYPFKVTYVDQRPGWEKWHYPEGRKKEWMWDGEKPALLISGPGLEKQPIPASMLKR